MSGVGLGGGPSAADDYEWVDLSVLRLPRRRQAPDDAPPDDVAGGPVDGGRARSARRTAARRRTAAPSSPAPTAGPEDPLAEALCALLTQRPLWLDHPGLRILCVDLDNLRAGPVRWRARMAAVVVLARQADRAHLAGQVGAVERARPHLAEFAEEALAVADGSDVADHALLDAAAADIAAADGPVQVIVVSNDNIFAALADHGPLVVLSPGVDALSDRLEDAASDILDLAALEADVTADLRG